MNWFKIAQRTPGEFDTKKIVKILVDNFGFAPSKGSEHWMNLKSPVNGFLFAVPSPKTPMPGGMLKGKFIDSGFSKEDLKNLINIYLTGREIPKEKKNKEQLESEWLTLSEEYENLLEKIRTSNFKDTALIMSLKQQIQSTKIKIQEKEAEINELV